MAAPSSAADDWPQTSAAGGGTNTTTNGSSGGENDAGDSLQSSTDVNAMLTIVYLAIFFIGVIGNVCNCFVIADSRNRYMKTATNYYLFSLSVSDLLLLIFGLPHDIVNLWHPSPYMFNQFVCISRGWISEASTYASVLVIVAFTVERYLAICHPLRAHTLSRLSRSIKIIVLIWLVASSWALVVVMQYGVISITERRANGQEVSNAQCTTVVRNEKIFELSVVVFFIIPMAVITILYVRLGYHLRRKTFVVKQNQIKKQQLRLMTGSGSGATTTTNKQQRYHTAACTSQQQPSPGSSPAGSATGLSSTPFATPVGLGYNNNNNNKVASSGGIPEAAAGSPQHEHAPSSSGCWRSLVGHWRGLPGSTAAAAAAMRARAAEPESATEGEGRGDGPTAASTEPMLRPPITKMPASLSSSSSLRFCNAEPPESADHGHYGHEPVYVHPSLVGDKGALAGSNDSPSLAGQNPASNSRVTAAPPTTTASAARRTSPDSRSKVPSTASPIRATMITTRNCPTTTLSNGALDASAADSARSHRSAQQNARCSGQYATGASGGGGSSSSSSGSNRNANEQQQAEAERRGREDSRAPKMETMLFMGPQASHVSQVSAGLVQQPAGAADAASSSLPTGVRRCSSMHQVGQCADACSHDGDDNADLQRPSPRQQGCNRGVKSTTSGARRADVRGLGLEESSPGKLKANQSASFIVSRGRFYPNGVSPAHSQAGAIPAANSAGGGVGSGSSSNNNNSKNSLPPVKHHLQPIALNSTINTASMQSVIKMLVSVVVMFFICWAPFHAQRLMAIYVTEPTAQQEFIYNLLNHVSGISYYISAIVNPILYSLFSVKFRQAFRDTFGSMKICSLKSAPVLR